MEDLRADLEAMRDVLRTRGWIQKEEVSPNGVCLIGAIRKVTGHWAWATEVQLARVIASAILKRHVHYGDGHAFDCITYWNDRPGRTYAEVDQLLADLADAHAPYPAAPAPVVWWPSTPLPEAVEEETRELVGV